MSSIQQRTSPLDDGDLPDVFINRRFADLVWSVEVHAQGAIYNLAWNSVVLGDGSALVDPKNGALLSAAKFYIIHAATKGFAGRGRLRGASLRTEHENLIQLMRWMTKRQLRTFPELTMAQMIGYRNYVRSEETDYKRRADRKTGKFGTAKPLSSRTVAFRLQILKRLASLQEDMGSLGTCLSHQECLELSDYLYVKVLTESRTEPIPDDDFREIFQSALDWLIHQAPTILIMQTAASAWREYRDEKNLTNYSLKIDKFRDMRELGVPENLTVVVKGKKRSFRSLTQRQVASLSGLTRGACFVIIASLVGMRNSEIRSLKKGCLSVLKIDNNGPEILNLTGTLFKTSPDSKGVTTTWVAGYNEPTNPVKLAIDVLEKLPRAAGSTSLFSAMYKKGSRNGRQLASVSTGKNLKAFLKVAGARDSGISPHQFRRTFARNVALSSSSSIFSLMRHFKHMSILMTERYLSVDPELINDVFEARQSIVAERLDSMFGAERLGGLAGKRIVSNNASYRGDENAKVRRKLVQMTISDPSAMFRLVPSGICIYEAVQAKCGGHVENVGLAVCITCKNFAIGTENLPYWRDLQAALKSRIAEQASLGFVSIDLHRQLEEADIQIATIAGKQHGSTA